MNRLFPNLPHNIPPNTHVHAMKFELPDTLEELDPALESFCGVFHESCVEYNTSLASVMYGFVMPDGAMPHLCELLAEKFEKPKWRMAIAVLCVMGSKFVKLELEQCRKDGVTAGQISPEWFVEHKDKHTFTHVCSVMEDELSCACAGCIMFWAGRQSVMSGADPEKVKGIFDRLSVSLRKLKDVDRHGPGCVRHLIEGADHGKWIDRDEEADDA